MNEGVKSQLTPAPERDPFEVMCRLWPFWTTPEDIRRVTNAMVISMHQHAAAKVKTRKYTGLPYWTHPFRVAMRTAAHPQMKLFWVSGALCHDVIEDTVYDPEEIYALKHRIVSEVGEDALRLVEELTNEKHDKSIPRSKRKEMDWQRLKDVSRPAKIVKMLDRIDNLTEMVGAPVEFKKLYCGESLELLKVVGDADKDIAYQLRTAVEYHYIWRRFSQAELEQKPFGVVFEHIKRGLCFVEEAGAGGHMKFVDGEFVYFSGNIGSEFRVEDVFGDIMRETSTTVKTLAQLKETANANRGV